MKVKLNTGIPDDERMKIIEELNKLLADVYVTFVQARNFHWNVVGKNFNDLHSKFQGIYEMMDGTGDSLAERVRMLDGTPDSTMAMWLSKASLKEVVAVETAEAMVVVLISNLESIIMSMRNMCEDTDEATETMLGAMMEDIEKQVWMLRSFLG